MKLHKDIKVGKPQEKTLGAFDPIKYYEWRFDLFLAKFKNGVYRNKPFCVAHTDRRFGGVYKEASKFIEKQIKKGRYHDWGFYG